MRGNNDFPINVQIGTYTDEGVRDNLQCHNPSDDFKELTDAVQTCTDSGQSQSCTVEVINPNNRGELGGGHIMESPQPNMGNQYQNPISPQTFSGHGTIKKTARIIKAGSQKETEMENLWQENHSLRQQNQALRTKLQNRTSTGIFRIAEQNGGLLLYNNFTYCLLSTAFIGFVVWVKIEEIGRPVRRVLAIEVKGQVRFFQEQELESGRVLPKLRIQSQERLEVQNVSDRKIAAALNEYLLQQAGENEGLVIPATAGWDSVDKKFYYMGQEEIFREIMEQMFPAHPLLKREFSEVVQNGIIYPFADGKMQNTLWELALFGSVLRSVLVENGVLEWFGVWIQGDRRGNDFIHNFLEIWHSYIPKATMENLKDVKKMLRVCRDEPLLLLLEKSSRSESNRKKMTRCLTSGQEFSGNIPVLVLPVFTGYDYGFFQQDEELAVFPFFLHDDFQPGQVAAACQMIPKYIRWCEENYTLLQVIIKEIYHGNSYASEEFSVLPVLLVIKAIVFAYHEFCYDKVVSVAEVLKFMENYGAEECRGFLEWIKRFNGQSALAKVSGIFAEEYNAGRLQIRNRIKLSVSQIKDSLIFDLDGSVYVDKDFFEQMVGRYYSKSICHTIIKNLVDEDVIYTEKNGTGRVRADLRRAMPKGNGNEGRFYRFKEGTLLNEAGYILGTQMKESIGKYISIGKDDVGFEIHFDIQKVMNRHITVTGITGSGKSSFAFSLGKSVCDMGIHCILFDYSGSFHQEWIDEGVVEAISVKDFPVNPMCLRQYAGGKSESFAEAAKRVSTMFGKVLKLNSGDEAIVCEALSVLYTKRSKADLANLLMEIFSQEIAEKSSLYRLQKLRLPEGQDGEQWGDFLAGIPRLKVIQMDGMPMKDAVTLTEFFLLDLISWYRNPRTRKQEMMLWLDEIQNLSADEGMPVDTLLREMRKYGLGVIAISQAFHTMAGSMQLALQQAATKFYFRQDSKGARKFASDQADTEAERRKLSREAKVLPAGEFFAVGDFVDVNGDTCNSQCWHVYPKAEA